MDTLITDEISFPLQASAVEPHAQAMLRILLDCTNAGQDDAEKCRRIAVYVAEQMMEYHSKTDCLPLRFHRSPAWVALDFIINEFGEPLDETYMGRDEHGEKQYHTFNPDTNWIDRCNNVLWPILTAAGYCTRVEFHASET